MKLAPIGTTALIVAVLALPARADDAAVTASGVDEPEHRISFGVGMFAGGFIASDDHEFYDPATSMPLALGDAELDVGVRASIALTDHVGVEGELALVPSVTDSGGTIVGLRAHVIGQYPMVVTPFAVAGLGAMGVASDAAVLGDDADMVAYVGLGARYDVSRSISVRVDGRVVGAPKARVFGGETAHYEVLAGAAWTFGSIALPRMTSPATEPVAEPDLDPDRDGFAGDDDACPTEPGVEPDGCPVRDTDGDGFVDADDACPTEAEVVNGFEDDDGCPDEVPDTDGDGIPDNTDQCKDEPEDIDGFADDDGCPDPDNDGDGLLDTIDQCPDEAGPPENGGCPDTDRDGDGVVDRLDNCPDEAGSPDNQGCIKKQLVIIKGSSIEILETVHFRTNKADIRAKSHPLLDNVAAVLNAHPELTKIEVSGHTDDVGKETFNQWLSTKRAEAVVEYLIGQGVAADRLVAVGYGESKPAVEGKSAKARQANRRVEFEVLESTIWMVGGRPASPEPEPDAE